MAIRSPDSGCIEGYVGFRSQPNTTESQETSPLTFPPEAGKKSSFFGSPDATFNIKKCGIHQCRSPHFERDQQGRIIRGKAFAHSHKASKSRRFFPISLSSANPLSIRDPPHRRGTPGRYSFCCVDFPADHATFFPGDACFLPEVHAIMKRRSDHLTPSGRRGI